MPLRGIAAREIMTSQVAKVAPDTPVPDLLLQMRQQKDDCPLVVVVVDPDEKPLGIVTERDIVSKILADEPPSGEYLRNVVSHWEMLTAHLRDRDKSQASVARELMASPAICVDEGASVAEVSGIMAANGVRQLPVLRRGQVVGLVCRGHIVRAIADFYSADSGSAASD